MANRSIGMRALWKLGINGALPRNEHYRIFVANTIFGSRFNGVPNNNANASAYYS